MIFDKYTFFSSRYLDSNISRIKKKKFCFSLLHFFPYPLPFNISYTLTLPSLVAPTFHQLKEQTKYLTIMQRLNNNSTH